MNLQMTPSKASSIVCATLTVDEASKALFTLNGLDVSTTNTWIISFEGETMYYELSRPGREFRVAVDLSKAVSEPPAAWGYTPKI